MYKSTPITQKCKSPLKLTVKVKNTDDEYKTKMKDFALNTKERYDEYEKRGWAQDDTTSGYRPKVANVSLITGSRDAAGSGGIIETSNEASETSSSGSAFETTFGEKPSKFAKDKPTTKNDSKPVSGDPYSVRQRERAVKVAERNLRRAERRGARNPGKYGTDYTSREEAVKQAKAMQKSPFKIRGCGKNKK